MKCCNCKNPIGSKERRFYSVYQTKNGRIRHKTWCLICDENGFYPEVCKEYLQQDDIKRNT